MSRGEIMRGSTRAFAIATDAPEADKTFAWARTTFVRHSPGVPDGSWARAPSAYVRIRPRRLGWLARSAAAGLSAIAAAVLAVVTMKISRRSGRSTRLSLPARRLYQGSALLSFSVLADSALEHYRGRFKNPAMVAGPTVGLMTLSAALLRLAGRPVPARGAISIAAVLTGGVGLLFHIYNIGKREGGFGWHNFFYAAPLGAPAAASLAGLFGMAASQFDDGWRGGGSQSRGAAAKALVLLSSTALAGTSAEVALLHFRGAFQNPFMLVPVAIPPLCAAVLGGTALKPAPVALAASRALLGTTAVIGLAGVGFHAYGIARNMGGWRNWSQMLLQGPPLPAPPSFTGVALAGLGALHLLEMRNDRPGLSKALS